MKKFKKTLDKLNKACYNKDTKQESSKEYLSKSSIPRAVSGNHTATAPRGNQKWARLVGVAQHHQVGM